MGARYTKYIKILDDLDKAIESKGMRLLEGKVTKENLEFLEKILCVMEKAWRVAWVIDHIDDIHDVVGKLAKRGEGPEETAMQGQSGQKGGGSEKQGHDFRPWDRYSGSETGTLGQSATDFGQEEDRRGRRRRYRTRSEEALDELLGMGMEGAEDEEARRGRRRRYRALLDALDAMDNADRANGTGGGYGAMGNTMGRESNFMMIPGFGFPTFMNNRMGYGASPNMPEQNAPYNMGGNLPAGNFSNNGMSGNNQHTTPMQNNGSPQAGVVHAPLQTGAQSTGNANATSTGTANNATGGAA